MKIWILPIENIPSRYPMQMLDAIRGGLDDKNIEYEVIGHLEPIVVPKSNFLDFTESNRYKLIQMDKLFHIIQRGEVKNGDTILFLDAWHPGVIALRQVLEFSPLDVKVAGYFHAGSYDPNDMLGQTCQNYFINFERSLGKCLDRLYFATKYSMYLFARNIIGDYTDAPNFGDRGYGEARIVGFPIDGQQLARKLQCNVVKENIIVFPHRSAIEKHPEYFDVLANYMGPEWECIKTLDVCQTKDQYHDLLRKAKFAVSFAEQETFGIAMAEATLAGCIPIMPNHKSYTELYADTYLYDPAALRGAIPACKAVYKIINNHKLNYMVKSSRFQRDHILSAMSAQGLVEDLILPWS